MKGIDLDMSSSATSGYDASHRRLTKPGSGTHGSLDPPKQLLGIECGASAEPDAPLPAGVALEAGLAELAPVVLLELEGSDAGLSPPPHAATQAKTRMSWRIEGSIGADRAPIVKSV